MAGVILFFMNHVSNQLYESLGDRLGNMSDYEDSYARDAITTIGGIERSSIWDYAFLAIFIGLMLQMLLFSFATRISIAFYWIFAILGIIILIVGTILSSIWQEIAVTPEFATTITRFPITNSLLGTYFPIAIIAVVLLGMIILFGKPPQSGGITE